MKRTKEQIESDKREQEIKDNLKKSADNQNKAAKELSTKIKEANEAISGTLEVGMSNTDKQKLANTIVQVNNLLKLAKSGKDVTKELNSLRIKK